MVVSGRPELALDIGGETRQAAYASGAGTAALVFEYTVADGDEDSDGIAIAANALRLAGGTIAAEVSATRHAVLAHDAVDADDEHLVDGVRPKLTRAETSDDGSEIELTFSENIGTATNRYGIGIDGTTVVRTVQVDVTDNVVTLSSLGVTVGEGQAVEINITPFTVKDPAGNGNVDLRSTVTNNVVRPSISSIALTSDPSDGVYAIGETVEATVTFSKEVTVGDSGGEPTLTLDIGGVSREAAHASGSGSAALVFSYTIAEGDLDRDGIAIGANELALNGATIRDSLGLDAKLGHDARSAQLGHKVDGVPPEPLSAVVDTEEDAGALVLTFFEALDGDSTPAAGAFAVTVGTADTANAVTAVAIDGARVTLTLTTDVAVDATNVKVGYPSRPAPPCRSHPPSPGPRPRSPDPRPRRPRPRDGTSGPTAARARSGSATWRHRPSPGPPRSRPTPTAKPPDRPEGHRPLPCAPRPTPRQAPAGRRRSRPTTPRGRCSDLPASPASPRKAPTGDRSPRQRHDPPPCDRSATATSSATGPS